MSDNTAPIGTAYQPITEMDGKIVYYSQHSKNMVHLDDEGNEKLINELDIQLVGAPTNLNPWIAINSASRQQMQANHLKQRLVIEGATVRRNLTGVEKEFAKYTFSQRMPVDATILQVIPKYQKQIGEGAIKMNPSSLIVYEDFETKEICSMVLENYFFQHTTLGWKYRHTDALQRANIRKGTVLADSPNVDKDGNYMYGIETNVAYLTVPGIIEDGFVVREGYLQALATTMMGSRTGTCGKALFPLNLYGNENIYKPFPGPGDVIREDGLVMAFRPMDANLTVTDLHPRNLLGDRVDTEFDKTVYGEPGARVTDVTVLNDHNARYHTTPTGMEGEMMKYVQSRDMYYKKILDLYGQHHRRLKDNLRISPEFHAMNVEALANFETSSRERVVRNKNKAPLDDFNIEITYAFRKVPTVGYKITDTHGTKGVIVAIWKDGDMPTTSDGIIADVIKDPLSVIKRSNIGQIFEQWTNQASTQCATRVRSAPTTEVAFQELLDYYRASSPYMFKHVTDFIVTPELIADHVASVIEKGIYLLLPPNSPNIGIQQVIDIENNCKSIVGPVTYRGQSGRMITTKRPVAIDTKYMMLLDKTGEDWSTVSIAKRQHHGIVVQLGRADKYLNPYRESPVRFAGESEVRLMSAVMDPDTVAELLDRTNSLASSEAINDALLSATKPTSIKQIINRAEVPRGNSRPLQLMKHLLGCGGVGFQYNEYDPTK